MKKDIKRDDGGNGYTNWMFERLIKQKELKLSSKFLFNVINQ